MGVPGGRTAKRVVLETLGWTLVVVGIAALVLPGPGLLAIFAGVALLAQQYDWAARRLDFVRVQALRGAAESVETWPRIALSVVAALVIAACGVVWVTQPPQPDWWPFSQAWTWLPGGLGTGIIQLGSAVFALGLLVWSYRRYRGKPEAREALERDAAALREDREERRSSASSASSSSASSSASSGSSVEGVRARDV